MAIALLAACLFSGGAGLAQTIIPVDDSYTVSSRHASNRAAHPEFQLPSLTMVAGQQIHFDRLYSSVGGRELHLDIFAPPADRNRGEAIILIHGGAWRSGNKSNFYAIANLLAQRGYVVFLPEYRLAPEALYPAGLIDINAAVAWVSAHAATYHIDPARIAIGGESSGGQMAALIAYTGGSSRYTADGTPSPKVSALIDIDGVLDFTSAGALPFENAAGPKSSAALWLGGSWGQRPEIWKEASPATHVGPHAPPTLVISGEHPRFTAGIETVLPTLDKHRIANSRRHFPGLPHAFWLFEPYATDVANTIDAFLQQLRVEE
jgi:pectinesterase